MGERVQRRMAPIFPFFLKKVVYNLLHFSIITNFEADKKDTDIDRTALKSVILYKICPLSHWNSAYLTASQGARNIFRYHELLI